MDNLGRTLEHWNRVHAIVMIVAFLVSVALNSLWVLGVLAAFSFFRLVYLFPHIVKGKANKITLFRILFLITLCFYWDIVSIYILEGIFVLNVILDVLDGYIARKFNEESDLGMIIDLEADAFFVILACFIFYYIEMIGFWILIPGVLRYLYKTIVSLLDKEKNFRETKKWYASYIAGIFFVILCVGLILPIPYSTTLLLIGSFLIIVSFSISFFEFFRFLNFQN
jgi:phosphatidylglycerophosphate synthase